MRGGVEMRDGRWDKCSEVGGLLAGEESAQIVVDCCGVPFLKSMNQRNIVACRVRAFAASHKVVLQHTIISVNVIGWIRFAGMTVKSGILVGVRTAMRPWSWKNLAARPTGITCAPFAV